MLFTVIQNNSKTKVLSTPKNCKLRFSNLDISIVDFPKLSQSSFILSRPLTCGGNFIRKKEFLKYSNNSGYVILDLDNVDTKEKLDNIIEYFKKSGWEFSITNSRSYDNVLKFNLKVCCKIDFESTDENIKNTLLFFKQQLSDYCSVDESAARYASYQAPTFNILLNENAETGKGIPFSIIPKTQEPEQVDMHFDDATLNWCKAEIIKRGGRFKKYDSYYAVGFPFERKSKFSYFWFESTPFNVFHSNSSKNINLLPEFIKSHKGKEILEQIQTNLITKHIDFSADKTFDTELITDSKFEFSDVTLIKSAMGTGKSEIIKQYIKDKSKVLFVSVRQTLARDMAEKYNCKHYIDDCKNLKFGDNYVVQINSLHKINLDYFDYVVLDEFESLLMYIVNGVKDSPFVISILRNFKEILETKKLLVLDAMLHNHSLFKRPTLSYENTFRDNTQVCLYEHKNTFFSALEYACDTKEKDEVVTASFSTLAELKMIESLLRKKGYKVIVVSSETSSFTRDKVFSEYFKQNSVPYDCVLFSPSITVGLSILNNVKNHFHFDNSMSIDAISSIQMIKRARKADNIHIYICGSTNLTQPLKRENIIETYDIPDLIEIDDFYKSLCYSHDLIQLNHTVAFKTLCKNQFKNISCIKNITNSNYIKNQKKKKEVNLDEFEYTESKDLITKKLKEKSNLIDCIRNFVFYTKNKNKEEYLDNFLISNPLNMLEQGDKVKFIKYCIAHPNIKLKTKFTSQDIKCIPTDKFLKPSVFLTNLGYKKNGNSFVLQKSICEILKGL